MRRRQVNLSAACTFTGVKGTERSRAPVATALVLTTRIPRFATLSLAWGSPGIPSAMEDWHFAAELDYLMSFRCPISSFC